MKQRQEALNAVVGKDPDVLHYVSFIGAGGSRGGAGNTGSIFINLRDRPARKVSSDEVIARLRPQLAKVEGRAALPPVGAGHQRRRPLEPDAVPVHAPERGPQRAQRLGAEGPRRAAEAAGAQGRRDRPADERPRARRRHRSRHGVAARDHAASDRRDALRRVRPGVRGGLLTQLNQYHVVLEVKPQYQKGPESLDEIYVKTLRGDAGAALGDRQAVHVAGRRSRSTTRASFRR